MLSVQEGNSSRGVETVSVALMCHPKRAAFVAELEEALPEAEAVWDEKNSRWDTGRRSLLAFDQAATHHLVVQDDSLPCKNLVEACRRIALHAVDNPVSLYIGRVRPHQRVVSPGVKYAKQHRSPFLAMQGPWWGPGLLIPTAHIPDLVEWGDKHQHIANYDKRISRWYDLQHKDCWYTVPSLVQHRGVQENPSLVRGRTGDRRAQLFIGDDDPLEIDWSQKPTSLKLRYRHRRIGKVVTTFIGSPSHTRYDCSSNWELVE